MSTGHTEPNAVIETRILHNVHRRATTVLAEAAGNPAAPAAPLKELRDFLVATLHHHHESEDDVLWPMITSKAPGAGDGLASLSGEHEKLDAALDALAAAPIQDGADRSALRSAAVAVRDLIHTHLEHEEPVLFPALTAHVTPEAWDGFSQQVVATSPQDGAHLMFGFLDQAGTPDEVALVLRHLPEPARDVIPMLRKQAETTLGALQTAN
jgi:hemerythrin-like domain-containing protein